MKRVLLLLPTSKTKGKNKTNNCDSNKHVDAIPPKPRANFFTRRDEK